MPIYEYVCRGCGNRFEALVLRRGSGTPCPECGSRKVSRQISAFAAHNGSARPCDDGKCPGSARQAACPTGKCPFA